MNANIDWHKYDGFKFQQLCNRLLIMEVSKSVEVFDKEGKDGGIDARYQGRYQEHDGAWRFQAKFHAHSSSNPVVVIRRDILADIRDHLRDEDYIVYLTNVKLLPQQKDKLIDAAQALVAEKEKRAKVLIWEGAHLEAILSSHPVLTVGSAMLQPYEAFFGHLLSPERETPFSFRNSFVGRLDSIQELRAFLDDPQEWLCSIVAPGGYGKTRLCFDLFEQLSVEKSSWSCWVLVRDAFEASEFKQSLLGEGHHLILMDDAHLEKKLSGILQLVSETHFRGKIKLILTTRSSLVVEVKASLSTHQDLGKEILLAPLSDEEGFGMILPFAEAYLMKRLKMERMIENFRDGERLAWQIQAKAKGVPLVVMTMVHAMIHHQDPHAIFAVKELRFIDIVWKYIKEEIRFAKEKLELEERGIKRAIQIMAQVSPFSGDDFEELADQSGIAEGDFKRLVRTLCDGGLLRKFNRFDVIIAQGKKEGMSPGQVMKPFAGKYEDYDEFSIVPDPYKDLIVADSFADTKVLTGLILSPFGIKFSDPLFNNILVALDVLPESREDGITIMCSFSKHIGLANASLELIKKTLLKAQQVGKKEPSVGLSAFLEILDLLENRADEWRAKSQVDKGAELQAEILKLAEDIFKTCVADLDINEGSYQILIRYCKAVSSWGLLAMCTEGKFTFGQGHSYHNITFLIQKVTSDFIQGEGDVILGLHFIGWILGLSDHPDFKAARLMSHYSHPYGLRDTSDIPDIRMNLLRYLWSCGQIRPQLADILYPMWLRLMCRYEAYFVPRGNNERHEYELEELQKVQAFAVPELLFVYTCIQQYISPRQRDFQFRYNFWLKVRHFAWHRFNPELQPQYEMLVHFTEESQSVGESIAFTKLWELWSDSEAVLQKITSLVGSIASASDAGLQLKAYFQVIDALNWKDISFPLILETYPYFAFIQHGRFDLREFYELLLAEHPELLWRGRGDVLYEIGFGTNADREFFLSRVGQLLELGHKQALSEILDAYMCHKPFEAFRLLDQRDCEVFEVICSQLERWYSNPSDAGNCKNISDLFVEDITYFVRLDHTWTEQVCRCIFPYITALQQQNLLFALFKQENNFAGAVPFFQNFLLERGWVCGFTEYADNLIKMLIHTLIGLRFERVFAFLEKHLQYRFLKKASLVPVRFPFIELNPKDPKQADFRWYGKDQSEAFGQVFRWYLDLDFDLAHFNMDDAWHLLKLITSDNAATNARVKEIFSKVYGETDRTPKHMLHSYTVLYLFWDDLDWINEFIQQSSMPQPSEAELVELSVGYDDSVRTASMRYLANFWVENCPYKNDRAVKFLRELRNWKYLWK